MGRSRQLRMRQGKIGRRQGECKETWRQEKG
jgi:hypothetical protein